MQRADGWCVEFLVSLFRGQQTHLTVCSIPACLNTPMIDPRKATKGRRMSKKTRKKSSKPAAGKAIRARSARPAKAAPLKARKATATKSGETKSGKNTKTSRTGNPTAKASHKAPSKKLNSPEKSDSPAIAAPKAAAAKTGAAKTGAGTRSSVRKLPVDKAGASPAPRSTPSAPVSVLDSVPWPRAQRRRHSACRATAAARSPSRTTPAKNWCCFSIHAPILRAAPRRPSTSPAWQARLRTAGRRSSAFRPTR